MVDILSVLDFVYDTQITVLDAEKDLICGRRSLKKNKDGTYDYVKWSTLEGIAFALGLLQNQQSLEHDIRLPDRRRQSFRMAPEWTDFKKHFHECSKM